MSTNDKFKIVTDEFKDKVRKKALVLAKETEYLQGEKIIREAYQDNPEFIDEELKWLKNQDI